MRSVPQHASSHKAYELSRETDVVVSAHSRGNRTRRDVLVLAVGALLGVACTAGVVAARHGPTRATVFEGWAAPSGDGTLISFGRNPDGRGSGGGYEIANTPWAGPDGQWHGGSGPTCVGVGDTSGRTKPTHVLLDVVNTQSANGTRAVVVALRCLR